MQSIPGSSPHVGGGGGWWKVWYQFACYCVLQFMSTHGDTAKQKGKLMTVKLLITVGWRYIKTSSARVIFVCSWTFGSPVCGARLTLKIRFLWTDARIQTKTRSKGCCGAHTQCIPGPFSSAHVHLKLTAPMSTEGSSRRDERQIDVRNSCILYDVPFYFYSARTCKFRASIKRVEQKKNFCLLHRKSFYHDLSFARCDPPYVRDVTTHTHRANPDSMWMDMNIRFRAYSTSKTLPERGVWWWGFCVCFLPNQSFYALC